LLTTRPTFTLGALLGREGEEGLFGQGEEGTRRLAEAEAGGEAVSSFWTMHFAWKWAETA